MFRLRNWQQSPAVEGRWSVIGSLRAWSMKYRDKQSLGGEAAREWNISFLRCNSIQRFKTCSHLLPLCPTFSPAHATNPFSFYCLLCFYWGFLDAHWSRYIFLSAVICVTGTHMHVQACMKRHTCTPLPCHTRIAACRCSRTMLTCVAEQHTKMQCAHYNSVSSTFTWTKYADNYTPAAAAAHKQH